MKWVSKRDSHSSAIDFWAEISTNKKLVLGVLCITELLTILFTDIYLLTVFFFQRVAQHLAKSSTIRTFSLGPYG